MSNPLFKILLFLLLPAIAFSQENRKVPQRTVFKIDNEVVFTDAVREGAERTDQYLDLLKGKSVAVVTNQTGMINKTHVVDSLLAMGVAVKKIMSPEHGFRGDGDAGEHIKNNTDKKTGLPVISLYGNHKKPTADDLKGIDVVIYDVQDVGVRFYTYISTLHYVMEACAEQGKQVIVFDRPNPNGYFIDGPILEKEFESFVGMHPVPIVYAMTPAEYARMINGEGWLKDGIKCDLKYISMEGYKHGDFYELPVKPSPNLPNMASVYLYPSLCLFEGTIVSVARGTDFPFQAIGHPKLQNAHFTFTPRSIPGASKNPKYEGELCKGYDLRDFGKVFIKNSKSLYLYWLKGTYENTEDKANFFNDYFNKLAGTAKLQEQIIEGKSEEAIKATWKPGLDQFKKIRKKYLLYQDFE